MGEFLQTQSDNIINAMKENTLNFLIYILKCLGIFVVESAEITCPIICLLALAFYVSGNRKAGKYVSGSFVFYFIAMALRMVLKCKA